MTHHLFRSFKGNWKKNESLEKILNDGDAWWAQSECLIRVLSLEGTEWLQSHHKAMQIDFLKSMGLFAKNLSSKVQCQPDVF